MKPNACKVALGNKSTHLPRRSPGQRKALAMAVKNKRTENRFSGLLARMLAPT
jgi:hypothetical protein